MATSSVHVCLAHRTCNAKAACSIHAVGRILFFYGSFCVPLAFFSVAFPLFSFSSSLPLLLCCYRCQEKYGRRHGLTDESRRWVQVKESASAAPARQPLELGTPYSSVANTVTAVGTQAAIPIGTACGTSPTTTSTKPLCSPPPRAASHASHASQATGPGRGQVVQGGARLTGQHPGPRGLCVYRRPQTKGQRGTQCVAVLESLTRSE